MKPPDSCHLNYHIDCVEKCYFVQYGQNIFTIIVLVYSLSKELEAVNGEHLEEKCVALQQELQRLQQILWQKQLKERKRPVAPPVQVKEKVRAD